MSVERVVKEISADEILYWEAMYMIDPWDIERIERSIATLTAITYNLQLTKETKDKAVKVSDYMPWLKIREASKDKQEDLSPTFTSRLHQMRKVFKARQEQDKEL
jgi:hypothetical protein